MTAQQSTLIDAISHALDSARFWLRSFVATDDANALHEATKEIQVANRAADDLIKRRVV